MPTAFNPRASDSSDPAGSASRLAPGEAEHKANPEERKGQLSRHVNVLLAVLLIAAASEFILRGPVRFLAQAPDWNDFILLYIPARAWLQGANLYSPEVYTHIYTQMFAKPWSAAALRSHPAYPLNTFVLISPLAPFPWPIAQKAELALVVVLIGAMIFAISRVANLEGKAACLFGASVLGLAPIHTGVATGNISITAAALACIAVWAVDAKKDVLAGVLLAIVISLKPQIGILFLAYYLVRRKWLTFSLAVVGTGLIFLVGAVRMYALGLSWVTDFVHNAHVWVRSNPTDDFASAGPMRYTLIDLQVPFYDLLGSKTAAVVLALAAAVTLGLIWLILFLRARAPDDLLNLSILATLSLLPVYHRFYDASLLVLPIAWTLRANAPAYSRLRKACWLLFSLFLIPGSSILERMVSDGHVALRVLSSWWWRHVLMPHEAWALLLIVIALLAAMSIRPGTAAERRPDASPTTKVVPVAKIG